MDLTKEEAVRVGGELKRLVRTSSFETAVDTLREQYRLEVFQSQPAEQEARERAYLQANALENLLGTFNAFIALYEDAALGNASDDEDQPIY